MVSGLETDLSPIQDPSLTEAVAGPAARVAAGAAIAVVGIALVFTTGPVPWIFPAMRGVRFASEQARKIPVALSDLERSRQAGRRFSVA